MSRLNPEIPTLTNVHDAMQDAKFEKLGESLKPTTVRIPENTLQKADLILQTHGLNFSEWVRACTIALVRDYEILSKR